MYKSERLAGILVVAILVLVGLVGLVGPLPLAHADYGITMRAYICEDGTFEIDSMNYGIVHCDTSCGNSCITVESYNSSGKKIATCKYRYKWIRFSEPSPITGTGGGAKEEDCGNPWIDIPLPDNNSYAWLTWNGHKVYISMENLSNWKVPEFKGKVGKTYLPKELEPENLVEEEKIEDQLRDEREVFMSLSWLGLIPGILWMIGGILGVGMLLLRKSLKNDLIEIIKIYILTRPVSTGLLVAGIIAGLLVGKYLTYGPSLLIVLVSFLVKLLLDGVIIPIPIWKKTRSSLAAVSIYSWLAYLEASLFMSFVWIERYFLTCFFPFEFDWMQVISWISKSLTVVQYYCLPAIGNALLTAFPYLLLPLLIGILLSLGRYLKRKVSKSQ